MRLVLLGPPGAGKGTQAVVLSKTYKIAHISTGDMLRESIAHNEPLGMKAKEYMVKGELVPDEIVTQIVIDRVGRNDVKRGFVLDGFPRTVAQAESLDTALASSGRPIELALYFKTDDSTSIERLTGRRVCKSCGANYHVTNMPSKKDGICDRCGGPLIQREDDTERTIRNRLKVYNEKTQPLIAYYRAKGVLREVLGDLEVDKLFLILTTIFTQERLA